MKIILIKKSEYNLYLHPKQKISEYNWVKKYNIKIFKKPISVDFLNIDLILLSFSSSIVAWALEHKIKLQIILRKNIKYLGQII